METRITMTTLSRRYDGVEGVSWRGDPYHNDCLSRRNDGVEGVSWRGDPYHNDYLVQTV